MDWNLIIFCKTQIFTLIGSLVGVPGVNLIDEDAFEAFNYYRSSAWQIRGVKNPIENLSSAGVNEILCLQI